jgi:hypothetical protein
VYCARGIHKEIEPRGFEGSDQNSGPRGYAIVPDIVEQLVSSVGQCYSELAVCIAGNNRAKTGSTGDEDLPSGGGTAFRATKYPLDHPSGQLSDEG